MAFLRCTTNFYAMDWRRSGKKDSCPGWHREHIGCSWGAARTLCILSFPLERNLGRPTGIVICTKSPLKKKIRESLSCVSCMDPLRLRFPTLKLDGDESSVDLRKTWKRCQREGWKLTNYRKNLYFESTQHPALTKDTYGFTEQSKRYCLYYRLLQCTHYSTLFY